MTPEEATCKLFEASASGNVDDAKAALDAGADVNAQDCEQQTPLHWAVGKGHADVARLLIELGADINAKDAQQSAPLRLAALCGYANIVRILKDAAKRQVSPTDSTKQRRSDSDD